MVTGPTYAAIITDLLFRNVSTSAVSLNIILVPNGGGTPTGSPYAGAYYITQISIPANSGNNGSTPLASLAGLAPLLFDIDLAGNKILGLEPGVAIYVQNLSTLTGILNITPKLRNY